MTDLLPTGLLVDGTYRILGSLGEGGMGVVKLAQDERLDRLVAIKFMLPHLVDDDFRARFRQEAKAMARVSHPNVVQIHSYGEHEQVPYFVMEFVPGMTLEAFARAQRPMAIDIALRIVESLCDGLGAIHAAGAVHRDVKPANVLLGIDLAPKLTDLGLALLRRDVSYTDEIAGTPAYMAPEVGFQMDSAPEMAPRADVYALACIAYELLTGTSPFLAPTPIATILKQRHVVPPAPSTIRPELGPEVDAALARALAKDPVERTPSAEAFRRDLIARRTGASEPARILLAEDGEDFRDLMQLELAHEFPDAEIVAVRNGYEALAAFENQTPSVCIFDLQMPGLDGTELTSLVRARADSERVPILVLTGSGMPSDWQRLHALGADRFLVKPVVIEDVIAMVRTSLHDRTSRPMQPSASPAAHQPCFGFPHEPAPAAFAPQADGVRVAR